MNSRLDELQAAFLSVKLRYLDGWNKARKTIADRYYEGIKNTKLTLPVYTDDNVYHIFPVMSSERERLQEYLAEKGIHTLIHYPIAIHLQKAYQDMGCKVGDYPLAEQICATELSLPLYPGMTEDEIQYVIDCLNAF